MVDNMKIAISGAGGFLGSKLTLTLLQQTSDFSVIALTSGKEKFSKLLDDYSKRLKVYDKNDYEEIEWNSVDCFINCAFPRNSVGVEVAEGLKYIYDIVGYAISNNVKSIINISSQSVYDKLRTAPADEDSQLLLDDNYSIGKYSVELFISKICEQKKIKYTNLRMASLIGPHFDQRIVNKLIDNVLNNREITIMSANQKFGFLDIEDAVLGIISVLKNMDQEWKPIYNLGTNDYYSLLDIWESIKQYSFENGYVLSYKIMESEAFQNSSINCNLFFNDFEWFPKVSLDESVERIFISKQ